MDKKTDKIKPGVIFHDIEKHADEKILARLSAVGDTLEQMSWEAGWLVDRLYQNLLANGLQVDYLTVCYYVSVASLRGQRSMHTVKRWALTARFFPPKVARKYGADVLPFSHFTYAASFDDQKDAQGFPLWEKVLRQSWDHYSGSEKSFASHLSVDALRETFEGKRRHAPASGVPVSASGFIPSSTAVVEDEEPMGEGDSETLLERILNAIAVFSGSVRATLPLLAEKNPNAARGLSGILSLLEDLRKTLRSL